MPLFAGNRRPSAIDELNGLYGGSDVGWTPPIAPQPQTAPQPRRGGMFGAGGVGRNIAGAIGDMLLQRAGAQPIYAPQMEMQRRLSLADVQRGQEWDDWVRRQEYEAANRPPPPPSEYERTLIDQGIQRGTPQWQAAMARRQRGIEGSDIQVTPITEGGTYAVLNRFTGQEVGAGGGSGNPQPLAPPQPGEVRRGYRFRGGDPADQNSWEPVQGGAAQSSGPRTFR